MHHPRRWRSRRARRARPLARPVNFHLILCSGARRAHFQLQMEVLEVARYGGPVARQGDAAVRHAVPLLGQLVRHVPAGRQHAPGGPRDHLLLLRSSAAAASSSRRAVCRCRAASGVRGAVRGTVCRRCSSGSGAGVELLLRGQLLRRLLGARAARGQGIQ